MTHGSLFSGIGGFDLASEWMGWDNIFHCEKDLFCQRVLKYHWPHAIIHEDIKTTDFAIYRGRIDVLSGGFPCQPFSSAGKRKGTSDDRHLWPEMLRAISEIQPRWVVGENVRGLASWNGGVVFEQVCADLETQGYEVQPFVLPASGVNAPHRRDRVVVVAHADDFNRRGCPTGRKAWPETDNRSAQRIDPNTESQRRGEAGTSFDAPEQRDNGVGGERPTSDSDKSGLEVNGGIGGNDEQEQPTTIRNDGQATTNPSCSGLRRTERRGRPGRAKPIDLNWNPWPTVEPLFRPRNDGLSGGLDGITLPKWRNESIKAAGNAVVPQLILQVFKAIEAYDALHHR